MTCQCTSGFTGRYCESDIDACEVNMNPCYPGVECKDLPAPANVSGYECGPCPSGFTGQGDSCSDIDECEGSTHGCSQVCANTPGSFTCDCNHGYLLNIDGHTCDDVNECLPASDCMQGCHNTKGSYKCTCDKYFRVDPANPKRCLPESPCKDGNNQCQHICYVSNGADHCACRPGYKLQKDGTSCSDIDECQIGRERCNQICQNTIGWYDCSCVSGFRLDTDNVTCIDIDECIEWTFNCSASLRCENTIGSYKCQCEEGMFWIENRCRELDKGEKAPKPGLPPPPRTPSKKDLHNSINVTVIGLNVSEWNQPKDLKFKKAVAFETTEFCAQTKTCLESKTRLRRSNADYITFTSDQVHLLPGFPMQLSYSSDDMIAIVAFYVKFPPGVAIGVTDTVDKTILVGIVNGSLTHIGRSINKTILSVTVYMVGKPTTTTNISTTIIPTTQKQVPTESNKLNIIIGGSFAGFIVIIFVIAIIIKALKRNQAAQVKEEVAFEMRFKHEGLILKQYDLKQSFENRVVETDHDD